MRVLEKLLLLVLVVLLLIGGAGLIGLCFMTQNAVFHHAEWLLLEIFRNRWVVLIVGGALLLLAVLLFFGVVLSRGKKGEPRRGANVVKVGEGESNVQISTSAVDCIIQQQKQKFPSLVAIESRISDAEQGAEVVLKITAKADANMQDLSTELRESVRVQLQDMVGMRVAVVKVIIADVVTAEN